SAPGAAAKPSPARHSSRQYSSAATRAAAATPVASHNGPCQSTNSGPANEGDQSAAAEPSRASDRFRPNAKPSSRPENHFASTVVAATINRSEPTPSRNRPASITAWSGPHAVSAAAATHTAANAGIARFVPQRSIA